MSDARGKYESFWTYVETSKITALKVENEKLRDLVSRLLTEFESEHYEDGRIVELPEPLKTLWVEARTTLAKQP